jgi:hypothetical protein
MEFQMTVENLDRFEEALSKYPHVAAGELENQIKYAALKMITALQIYPPVPYGSTYQRTNTLRDGWLEGNFNHTYVGGFDFDFNVTNNTEYAGFVQGGKNDFPMQTRVHKEHGWSTTDTIANEFDSELSKTADETLEYAIRDVFNVIAPGD